MAMSEKRCLYEVLGLSTECSADEIRSAYKRLALQRHPDKLIQSGQSPSEATASFQELVNAYEVLSDPKERSWYDSHRSQILFSNPTTSSGQSPIPNLFSFFSSSVYCGFSDSGKGFFKVYSDVFDKVYVNEINFSRKLGSGLVKEAPVMGNLNSPYSQVKAFYDYWLGFVTVMDFCWADQYDAMAGSNRKSRRLMEDENKKARKKAKREFHETVRGLVEFVRKRDKRVIDMTKKRDAEVLKKREEERLKKRQMEKEKEERARAYQEPEWARVDETQMENELKEMEDNNDGRIKKGGHELYCLVCKKKFKTDKQWNNHEQSKKHKERISEFINSVTNDEELEEDISAEVEEEMASKLDNDHFKDEQDRVDELNECFKGEFIIEQEESKEDEVLSSNEVALDVKVDAVNSTMSSPIPDYEDSTLEGITYNHSSKDAESMISSAEVHGDFNGDNVGLMEYNNRKSRRRNKEVMRGKKKDFGTKAVEENGGPCTSNLKDPPCDSLTMNDNGIGQMDQKRPLGGINKTDERKHGAGKQDIENKSWNSSKGRKQKGTSKRSSSNKCDACGEEFDSSNQLHRHLGETGHATIKSSR